MSLLKKCRDYLQDRAITLGVIALGSLALLCIASLPITFLIANTLHDDAFYYFEIARNIVAGHGSTFDGINLTNGYHPLWLVILLPIFGVFSSGTPFDSAPIYVALYLSVVLFACSGYFLAETIRNLFGKGWAQEIALCLWMCNPFLWYEVLNGLETSLMLALLALFVYVAVRVERHAVPYPYVVLGLIGGALILARLDAALYVIACACWPIVQFGVLPGLRRSAVMLAVAGVVVLPWVAWNYATFGMLLTSASGANPLVNHVLTAIDGGVGFAASVKSVVYMIVYYGKDLLLRTGAPWLVFAVLGILTAEYVLGKKKLPSLRSLSIVLYVAAGFALLFIANAGIRFTGRSWYFIAANLFLVLGFAYVWSQVGMRTRQAQIGIVAVLVCVFGTYVYGWHEHLLGTMQNQNAMLSIASWIDTHVPEGESVGVFNAGVTQYFSRTRVVNLDGLVNNRAYQALQDRNLSAYIAEEGIRYIADGDIYMAYRFKPFLGDATFEHRLTELVRFSYGEGTSDASSVAVFRLSDASEVHTK